MFLLQDNVPASVGKKTTQETLHQKSGKNVRRAREREREKGGGGGMGRLNFNYFFVNI